MTNLTIFSEIGRLRAVVVHCPGPEVEYMTPNLMHQLLFDDILFRKEARQEHLVFSKVLRKVADEVMDVQELLAEALISEKARRHFIKRFVVLHGLSHKERDRLQDLDPATLAHDAVTGWYESLEGGANYRFHFPPVPNLLFMRDPASVIGHGVSINNMATSARKPEPFLLDTIFRFHPRYHIDSEEKIWFDTIPSHLEGYPEARHTMEGGDILVLSEDTLAVGVSIRTSQSAVTLLAERLRNHDHFKTLFAVLMPEERAVMHLDTIFTRIDREHCLIFPPLLTPGDPHALPALKMDLTSHTLQISLKDNFLDALHEHGIHLEPVFCGGKELIHQEREQWTDGANAFCLAPGVILGYSRNVYTAEELSKIGYNVIDAEEVLARDPDLLDGKRYFILIRGNELSRARGGPRCMTMPLKREP